MVSVAASPAGALEEARCLVHARLPVSEILAAVPVCSVGHCERPVGVLGLGG